MTRQFKAAVLGVSLAISLLPLSALAAEQAKPAPPAPIPAQIVAAKKVFVANAGGDAPWIDDGQFSGGSDRTYNQFYAAMKTWGRYELVGAPADADLLFEIEFAVPPIAGAASRGDTIGGRPYDPQFRLVIRDPKTNALLWAYTEHAAWAILQGNRDKNFDQALAKIVSDIQGLSASADANKP
jgi:hypothetical protein